ncbi:unnamed protein product, partial [Mesorhabditis spiculigera]
MPGSKTNLALKAAVEREKSRAKPSALEMYSKSKSSTSSRGKAPKKGKPRCHETDCDHCGHPCTQKKDGNKKNKPGAFIAEKARVMTPSAIFICNGSVHEADEMIGILTKQGIMEPLSSYQNVHLVRTDPADTARSEQATFISHRDVNAILTGGVPSPNGLIQYMAPDRMDRELERRFAGCMRGRTMYVLPFSMGPVNGKNSMNAVQLTDSPYVVLNTRIMASLEDNEVWSFGSGYGGNSLLGKKALSLRLASWKGHSEGWLAEHAALLCVTDPAGKDHFITFHAPSGGGKTDLAFAEPTIPGWKISVLGDDISWIRPGPDGNLYASAPENGMFGIAPGLDPKIHPSAFKLLAKDALLVNTASTSHGNMYWKSCGAISLSGEEAVRDWQGIEWGVSSKTNPAHPNARFTAFTENSPNVHKEWDNPQGVPLTAMIFCSRRPDAFPLCLETNSWAEGVTLAAGMRAEASAGSGMKAGSLLNDPMGMRPFLAYNIVNYLQHWLDVGEKAKSPPKIFHVNWYRTDDQGKMLWPGHGENIRVLEWILGQATADAAKAAENAVKNPLGQIPKSIRAEGLEEKNVKTLLEFEAPFWVKEVASMKGFFASEMGKDVPAAISTAVTRFEKDLGEAR